MYGGEVHIVFWWGSLRKRYHFEDPSGDGRIIRIKMDLQEVGCEGMDWIDLARDRDNWRAVVSAVMNPRVPLNTGSFLTS
jgi:hypothetical protein